MRPRCSILTGGFDFSGCGDCTSCPPFEQIEMSNSEPSVIVRQGIPACVDYTSIRMEKLFAQGSPPFTLSVALKSRTGLASPVENQACGIAKYPKITCSSARGADDSCKRLGIYRRGQTGSKGNWLRTENAEATLCASGSPAARAALAADIRAYPGPTDFSDEV